jgi:hypothetical protein
MKIVVLFLIFVYPFVCLNSQIIDSITTDKWQNLTDSKILPKNIKLRHSNNNLDIIRFKDKYYIGIRTAPTHFASKKTKLYLVSTKNFQDFEYETEFWLKADMREPRFLVQNDTLFFYFFEGGTKMFKFQPKHIWVTTTVGDKNWAEKRSINLDAYVPWRLKSQNGLIYLSAYYGKNLYNKSHKADLRLFTSTNGYDFKPLSEAPQVTTQGAEEGEFEFDQQGNLWATIRLEGSGSYVAFAHKDSLHIWKTVFSKKKYDSALMFNHQNEMYVVARRHLKKNGDATPCENPKHRQRRRNMVRYSFSRKRTALYRLDTVNFQLIPIQDFPSHGDNAFPGIAKIDDNSYYLLNYSNKIYTKKDKKWIWGQLGKTFIYWTILKFPPKKIDAF